MPRLNFYCDSASYIVYRGGYVHFTLKDPGEIFFEKLSIVGHSGDTSSYQTSYLDLTINDIEIPAGKKHILAAFVAKSYFDALNLINFI